MVARSWSWVFSEVMSELRNGGVAGAACDIEIDTARRIAAVE